MKQSLLSLQKTINSTFVSNDKRFYFCHVHFYPSKKKKSIELKISKENVKLKEGAKSFLIDILENTAGARKEKTLEIKQN